MSYSDWIKITLIEATETECISEGSHVVTFGFTLFCFVWSWMYLVDPAWPGQTGEARASLFPLDAGRRTCLGSPRSLGSVETLILILGLLLTRLQYLERDPELSNETIILVLILSITVGVIKNCTLVFVNFSAQGASILKISVPIIKRRSWRFQNTPNLLNLIDFKPSYSNLKKMEDLQKLGS